MTIDVLCLLVLFLRLLLVVMLCGLARDLWAFEALYGWYWPRLDQMKDSKARGLELSGLAHISYECLPGLGVVGDVTPHEEFDVD